MRVRSVIACVAFLPLIVGATDNTQTPAEANANAQTPGAYGASCPTFPKGDLIGGLTTGQVVTSGQTVTLRFSSKVFTCSDWSNEVSFADCRDWWSFNLTVPSSTLSPGVYKLSEIGTQFGDLVNVLHTASGQGCNETNCEGRTEGTGVVTIDDPAATLEIYCASDGYVAGRLTGLQDPNFHDAPNFNGEFFALQCP